MADASTLTGKFKSAQTQIVQGGKMLFENGKYQAACTTWTPIGRRGHAPVGKRNHGKQGNRG